MSTITKDLGIATAYGYAKSKGYTGTEEEFAQLMADYASVGQSAAASAAAAAQSEANAQGAAEQAAQDAADIAESAAQIETNKRDIQTLRDEKAETDGCYENMTVGNAEQLVSTVMTEDEAPYNFRTAGGSADVGNRAYDTLVGGTLVWNQSASLRPEDWTRQNTTVSVSETTITVANSSAATVFKRAEKQVTADHVYFFSGEIITPGSGGFGFYVADTTTWLNMIYASPDGPVSGAGVYKVSASNVRFGMMLSTRTETGNGLQFRNLQLIDITAMFGTAIADYVYSLEQATPGAGVAWFRRLFPKDYYAYNPGELMSVQAARHDTVGFNAYNPTTGTARLLGGNAYQITGSYTALAYVDINGDAETITPDSDGIFTPAHNGTLTITGGSALNTCVHLVHSGYRNGAFEAYTKNSYPLDSSLILRGVPRLDEANNLYYDGDIYESDGTVIRQYEQRAYQAGDESLADAVTDGTNTVVKLATPTAEAAAPFQSPQIVDDFGTEEYADAGVKAGTRDVAIPVGHVTKYPMDLRGELEKLLASLQPPTADGAYTLKVTVTGGEATYSWEATT